MNNKLTVTCISDLHTYLGNILDKLPKSDVLLIVGDLLSYGNMKEYAKFCRTLNSIHKNYDLILATAGNHDHIIYQETNICKIILKENVPNGHLLIDEEFIYKGIKFYLSPWSPRYGYWYFQLDNDDGERVWSKIPDDCTILATHTPVYGILDQVQYLIGGEIDSHVGCKYLLERIKELNISCHVAGHIHEQYNQLRPANPIFKNALFLNSSICDLNYNPVNKPWLVEVDLDSHECDVINY